MWEGESQRTALAYDAHGRVVERIDALGARTRFVHEGRELCAVIDPAAQRLNVKHDDHGELLELSAPNGAVWRWQYDAL
ncbi:hypothetical protein INP30_13655, partial [Staphylococcus aureus]|nr:hypothetical protein [Staphylococcus aureus]